MIRPLAFALALAAAAPLPAAAADRQLAINDAEYMMWANIGQVMDRCIGAMVLRREPAGCADVSVFLAEFAGKVRVAPAVTPSVPSPPTARPAPSVPPPAEPSPEDQP